MVIYGFWLTDPIRAHKMTVPTVIAGQVKPIRTTVEQP